MPSRERVYRYGLHSDLMLARLTVGETDLAISLPPGIWTPEVEKQLRDHIIRQRSLIQEYIGLQPAFAASHRPLPLLPGAPPIVRQMAQAAQTAGVGPMAAVAGALAAVAGEALRPYSGELVVENGGDIYIAGQSPRVIGVYAGEHSPFSGRLGVKLLPADMPCGICTSSGTLGSSFSYGRADAALVIAPSTALADAMATAAANLVQDAADVENACRFALSKPGVRAALILCGEAMAVAGQIELTAI